MNTRSHAHCLFMVDHSRVTNELTVQKFNATATNISGTATNLKATLAELEAGALAWPAHARMRGHDCDVSLAP